MNADRNLLLGLLAVQNDLITREQLLGAMEQWTRQKDRALSDILVERQALTEEAKSALEVMVALHVQRHGGDPARSLARVGSASSVVRDLRSNPDPDLHASLDVAGIIGADSGPDAVTDLRGMVTESHVSVGARTLADGRFRVLRFHRAGGMGRVSVAEDTELPRQVALKEIKPEFAVDAESRARFLLEAEVNGGLEHPGIVPVYGLGTFSDGRPFYAMRFVEGDNFKEAINRFHKGSPVGATTERSPPPPPPSTSDFGSVEFRGLLQRFVDVCHAMQYAHDRGVLHRDLKPDNIMLGKYGETLVVDWGLAKAAGKADPTTLAESPTIEPKHADSVTPTRAGQAKGTLAYMSPEQAAGRIDLLGPAADVYSLGATLYHVLVGKAPITGKDFNELIRRVQKSEFPKPREVDTRIPRPLEAVCLKAMAVEPKERYGSARDLLREIEAYLADEPVSAWREPATARAKRWIRKHAALAAGIAATLLVGMFSLGVGFVVVTRAYEKEREARELATRNEVLAKANEKKAETEFRRAKAAIDEYFTDVSQSKELTEKYPGMHEFRIKLLEKAQKYYEEFLKERGDDPALQYDAGKAFSNRASVAAETGRTADAMDSYKRALAICEKLTRENPAVPAYAGNLAATLVNHGVFQMRVGDSHGAMVSTQKAIEIFKTLAQDNTSVVEYSDQLANAFKNLGYLQRNAGDPKGALYSFGMSLEIWEQLAREVPNSAKYQLGVCRALRDLAILHNATGNKDRSLADFTRVLRISERLAHDNPASMEYANALAEAFNNVAIIQMETADIERGLANSQRALAIRKKLAWENPALPKLSSNLATSYQNLALLQRKTGNANEAIDNLQMALAIWEKLTRDYPAIVEHAVGLGGCHCNLAILVCDSQSPVHSLNSFEKAVAVLTTLAKGNQTARKYLGRSHWGRARALAKLERLDESLLDFDAALKLDDGSNAKEIQAERDAVLAEKKAKVAAAGKSADTGALAAEEPKPAEKNPKQETSPANSASEKSAKKTNPAEKAKARKDAGGQNPP